MLHDDKKVLNGLFLGVILLLLLAGLITALLFPHDVNTYENRYAEKVEPFSVRAFLDGSFQDSMDKALAGICIIFIISSGYNPFIYFRF